MCLFGRNSITEYWFRKSNNERLALGPIDESKNDGVGSWYDGNVLLAFGRFRGMSLLSG
jgi:hypothetical protein